MEVFIHDPSGPDTQKFDPWQILALEAFFKDDDDADSIYDDLR